MVKIYIKTIEKNATIGGKFCFKGITEEVRNEEHIKQAVKDGVILNVYTNGKWIEGNKHFADVIEEKNEEDKKKNDNKNEDEKIDFEEIFHGHWTKQVQKVEEYDDPKIILKILEYAESNDVSDGVIKRIKEHLETL